MWCLNTVTWNHTVAFCQRPSGFTPRLATLLSIPPFPCIFWSISSPQKCGKEMLFRTCLVPQWLFVARCPRYLADLSREATAVGRVRATSKPEDARVKTVSHPGSSLHEPQAFLGLSKPDTGLVSR